MGKPERIAEMLAALDDDHAHLRELGGNILRAIDANDVDLAARALLQLQGAQTAHFRFEEGLMEEAGFPGRATHAESHDRLVTALEAINNALGDGQVSSLSRELGAFIDESLRHISELDDVFHNFLTDRLA
jgi:hemerythrin-like metal-binding protein